MRRFVKKWTTPIKSAISFIIGKRPPASPPVEPKPELQPAQSVDTSQYGEASAIAELIETDYPACLVDVGAHDGRFLSNSWPFIQQGWRAIAIEPLPKVFQQLEASHHGNPNVSCINKACADFRGQQKLFIGKDGDTGTWATLCQDDNELFRERRSDEFVLVEVETLTQILAEHNFPNDFSLLLIDAEGMDYEVLLGLDFEQYRPRLIVTEEYPLNLEKHNRKHQLLTDNHYRICKTINECNTIWVHESHWIGSGLVSAPVS